MTAIFLKNINELGYLGMGLIHDAQDRAQWRNLVKTVMTISVQQWGANFLTKIHIVTKHK
jgi:hypothetical protein